VEPLGKPCSATVGTDVQDSLRQKFWAVGGGKGGVGKSVVSMMLGSMLARKGEKVILVDADLGGSNLHTLAGIRYPIYTLADFMQRRVENIKDVVMLTPIKNLQLICGADDILGLANPKHAQKERVFNNLKKLDADMILLDLGAGTSYTAMDFFLYAPNKLLIFTPQITSIQNAYGFIKSSLFRLIIRTFSKDGMSMELINELVHQEENGGIDSIAKLQEAFSSLGTEAQGKLDDCLKQFNINLIVNMVRTQSEQNVGNIVKDVAKNYLGITPEYLGYVDHDRILESSINNMTTYLSKSVDSLAGACFYDIASKIIRKNFQENNSDLASSYVSMGR